MAITMKTGSHLAALSMTLLMFAPAGCLPGEGAESDPQNRTGNPDRHESLLARSLTTALSENASPELAAELARLPGGYDMSSLPVIHGKDGNLVVAEQPATRADGPEINLNDSTRAIYTVGGVDWVTYFYIELPLPSYVTDADGGTIRLVMQHEVDGLDQVRVIDEHIGTEYANDAYGNRGRFPGRYGWTRQSGGGDASWILGDGTPHNLAAPWDWAWITDYRWLQGNSVLGGDTIRVYSHPHVTTRVIFRD